MFQGQTIQLQQLDDGFVEICFDRQGETINKLDRRTVEELRAATAELAVMNGLRGVLVTSAKSVFIVGADITEFGTLFKKTEAEIVASNAHDNAVFNAFEDLPVPTVVAINGFALGGGLEVSMAAAYRVMSTETQVGLPEVKLGLFPGYGGTVRLPRLAGARTAIDWIASGKLFGANIARAAGVVDETAEPQQLRAAALQLLHRAASGQLDWQDRQARKGAPVSTASAELAPLFSEARKQLINTSGKHQPAALSAVELMERSVLLDRTEALREECQAFAKITQTQAAHSMVQTFLSDQLVKKLSKRHVKNARPVRKAAVVGAGIMGGGIAYTSALRGVPVVLKDIVPSQLDLGISEARKLIAKQTKSGRLTEAQAANVLESIHPQLDYGGVTSSDVVIEAVVENIGVKHKVLAELEDVVREDAVIASNTSSLRIDDMAVHLKRPENFVGMHFFNPVPVMPLVEVIRGSKTSDAAVSTAVGLAIAMGKTPIVVKDCPGFLVNRVLTAYMRGFLKLVEDGADFEKVDKVLEAFGWPMGPAYLEDVVGIDTGSHVTDIIVAGYPERMSPMRNDALRLLADHKRYGQKSGIGFYKYEIDPNGKPRRSAAEDTRSLLASIQPYGQHDFSDQEIVERCMLPMIIEAASALEEGCVGSAAELDQALLLGVGFPPYLGGILKYADWLGLAHVVSRANTYGALGAEYRPTERMQTMAAAGERYYA